MYELMALWMRYFFVLLAIAFVARAWIITVRDNRRARSIRAWLPETGTIGEWLVLSDGAQVRRGARFPILNEGMIGSARRSDVRVQHPDVLREHAYFVATEHGLSVRPVGEAPVLVESQVGGAHHPAEGHVEMEDGDVLALGGFRMMLTMFDARSGRRVPRSPVPNPAVKPGGAPEDSREPDPFYGEPPYGGEPAEEQDVYDDDDFAFEDDDGIWSAPKAQGKARDTERVWRNENRTRRR